MIGKYMADIFSKKKRSEIMKKIGPKNSVAEKRIRDIIMQLRFNFCSHIRELPGTPDFVFKRKRKAIFINGCFWHGHKGCKRAKLPTTNRIFWKENAVSV